MFKNKQTNKLINKPHSCYVVYNTVMTRTQRSPHASLRSHPFPTSRLSDSHIQGFAHAIPYTNNVSANLLQPVPPLHLSGLHVFTRSLFFSFHVPLDSCSSSFSPSPLLPDSFLALSSSLSPFSFQPSFSLAFRIPRFLLSSFPSFRSLCLPPPFSFLRSVPAAPTPGLLSRLRP